MFLPAVFLISFVTQGASATTLLSDEVSGLHIEGSIVDSGEWVLASLSISSAEHFLKVPRLKWQFESDGKWEAILSFDGWLDQGPNRQADAWFDDESNRQCLWSAMGSVSVYEQGGWRNFAIGAFSLAPAQHRSDIDWSYSEQFIGGAVGTGFTVDVVFSGWLTSWPPPPKEETVLAPEPAVLSLLVMMFAGRRRR